MVLAGAGYAAINAFNAASKYMEPGQRVVVVDRGYRWGGHWPDQYSFVRLHQGFRSYTAGERKWSIDRPDSHLASKDEILMHFDEVVAKVVAETGIELVECFGFEYQNDYRVEHGKVCFTAHALIDGAANVEVTADRMISGRGFDLHTKQPLSFNTNVDSRFHSLVPPDLGSGHVMAQIRYPSSTPGLIVVIGSGKTAMDCMIKLAELGESVTNRMRCISGRGTWFACREVFGSPSGGQHMLSMIDKFNGQNGKQVLREMADVGFLHSAMPDPSSFQVGVCSQWEVELVRKVLTPIEERVHQAYLTDISVDPHSDGTILHLLPVSSDTSMDTLNGSVADGQLVTMPLPAGSFIVNCTIFVK